MLSDQEVSDILSVKKEYVSGQGFKIGCCQLNILDPKVSLNFYCNVLGMKLLKKLDFPQAQFSDYMLGYVAEDEDVPPKGSQEETLWTMTKSRTVDLRHNWDRKTPYEIGSAFSNLSILVPHVYMTCKRLEDLGVPFLKKADEGGFAGLAVIRDPDGYPIEIYSAQTVKDHCL